VQTRPESSRKTKVSVFSLSALDWFERWKTEITESTAQSQWKRLMKHIVPVPGALPISEASNKYTLTLSALRPFTIKNEQFSLESLAWGQ
jgi:hypothetical protein